MNKKSKQNILNPMILKMIEEERDNITYDSVEELFASILDIDDDEQHD